MITDITLIFLLILGNGFFAAAEMALVAARKARLQSMADEGNQRAATVLTIQEKPVNFLATVQIGITLIATLASAVGGAQLVKRVSPTLSSLPYIGQYAEQIALVVVVLLITFVSLVVGELVPKRLALKYAEGFAIWVAPPVQFLSRIAYVPLRILSFTTEFVLRLFGVTQEDEEEPPTPQEIEFLVREAAADGTVLPVAEQLISRVFDYTDARVLDVMTPRTDLIALDVEMAPEEALDVARESGFSRFPVFVDHLDTILGYVHVKDIIWAEEHNNLRPFVRGIVYLPGSMHLPDAFSRLTREGKHMAIVLDEFGGTDGILTLEDLLEMLVGEIEDEHSPLAEQPSQQISGDWLVSGSTPLLDLSELLGIEFVTDGSYTTIAGYLLDELGTVPQGGEQVFKDGFVFTVEEMDRLRIASVRIHHRETAVSETTASIEYEN